MNIKIALFLPLLAALGLCGGCVSSKTPVGDRVAVLKPEVWNGKWRGGDGEIVRTWIKDLKLGIVEMTTKRSWLKPSEREEILVRKLGPVEIANQEIIGAYEFGRVAIDGTHLVIFNADEAVFERLIKRHEIAGKLNTNKNGKTIYSCTVGGFSEKDYQRLKKEGFDVRSLFDLNPDEVLVRCKGMPLW